MSTNTNSDSTTGAPKETLEEIVSQALNQQGFLFQQRVYHEAKIGFEGQQHRSRWTFEGAEYPVTAVNGRQTKIDLVLQHSEASSRGLFLCVECKRANPNYRAWVLFGSEPMVRNDGLPKYHFEIYRRMQESVWEHRIHRSTVGSDWPVYTYYLELSLDNMRPDSRKRSSTDAVEDAFSQVMFGHSGLVEKLCAGERPSKFVSVIPVVVTTANLYSATFDLESVDLGSGRVGADELTVEPLECAVVNYHASDELKLSSPDVVRGESQGQIESDIKWLQTRSIFVVNANHLGRFLLNLGNQLPYLFL